MHTFQTAQILPTYLHTQLGPRGFAVESQAPVGARNAEHLVPPGLGQPLDGPEGLLGLLVGRDAGSPLDGPYLDLAVESATEQVLARVVPVEAHDPRRVARKVVDVLAVLRVVDGDDPRVASGSEARS